MSNFSAIPITDKVYWVGAIDWGIRDFHGYKTSQGTTYNAYLIMDDLVVLVDTVKESFCEEMFSRIDSVLGSRKIDYIISNHSEMDHSGVLCQAMQKYSPQKVFASTQGVKALNKHFNNLNLTEVKNLERLNLGSDQIIFIETRMMHWPDSMMSYLCGEKVLFSQDVFGMHLATTKIFCDEFDKNVIYNEACKYFANILLPFCGIINKKIQELISLNLPISIIATDHGPIWRQDIEWIIQQYLEWSKQVPNTKALVVYDTMWKSTELMALAISEGIRQSGSGIDVFCLPLFSNHRSDIATMLINAGALIVGTPTINNQMFPTVSDMLTYIKGLKAKNLVAGSFGSYGWSGQGAKHVHEILQKDMGLMCVDKSPLQVNYVPNKEELLLCNKFGHDIAMQIQILIDNYKHNN